MEEKNQESQRQMGESKRETQRSVEESNQETQRRRQYRRAILFVILEALGFALMSFFVKLSGDLPTMQKAFFRNAVASVVSILMLSRTPERFAVRKSSWPLLFWRCLFGTTGLIMNFWAIDHLAIADANILNKMSPFFAILMSAFILGEIPSLKEVAFVALAFLGAAFVVKPTAGLASLPALIGLLSGFGAGTAYTFVRKLGTQGERGPVIVMCFSVFSSLVTLPFLLLQYQPMALRQWIFLILAGVCAAVAQICVTKAYTLAPARAISVYDYSQVIFAALLGAMVFHELPDWMSVAGYILIIGAAVIRWRLQK